MKKKLTEPMLARAKQLRAERRSFEEISVILSKDGEKVSKASVVKWLKAAEAAEATTEPPVDEPPSGDGTAAPEAEELDDDPSGGPDAPEGASEDDLDMAAMLRTELRKAQADADTCRVGQDQPGVGRAMRVAATLATLLQKENARSADAAGSVRVKPADMAAAATRARSKLMDLIDRLSQEKQREAGR